MNDPVRLLGVGSALERELLETARADGGSADGLNRTLAAAAAAAAATASAGGASAGACAAAAGAKGAAWVSAAKLMTIAVIAAGAGVGAIRLATAPAAPNRFSGQAPSARAVAWSSESSASTAFGASVAQPPAQPTAVLTEPSVKRLVEPCQTPEQHADAQAPSAAPPPKDQPAPASTSGKLTAEMTALNRAQQALEAGRGSDALAEVSRYQAAFPSGSLLPEARVIEIEALIRTGQRARATALARSFLTNWPSSPHCARIHSLLPGIEATDAD